MIRDIFQNERDERSYEQDATVEALPKTTVVCYLCRHWVPESETVYVLGQNDLRAHICLKHIGKAKENEPLHQAQ